MRNLGWQIYQDLDEFRFDRKLSKYQVCYLYMRKRRSGMTPTLKCNTTNLNQGVDAPQLTQYFHNQIEI